MRYEDMIRHYAAGEQTCAVCQEPLAAHQTWPGARFKICDSLECRGVIKHARRGRYVSPNEHKCEGPGCENFIPAGKYDARADYLTCCGECWIRRRTKGNRVLTCGCGCGQEFLGRAEREPVDGLYFLSSKHYGDYQHNKYLTEHCGPFRALVVEYLEGFVKLHYKEQQTTRRSLGPFFLFLNDLGITSLDDIGPRTITQYLTWAEKEGRRCAATTISFLGTFFKWARGMGYMQAASPVIPLIHNTRKHWRMPRPLDVDEMKFTWQLLHDRGNARLRLAAAIAEEAGLRLGEICRLRLQDVNLKKRTLFIGLPNKGNRERMAFVSEQTVRYYDDWLRERDPNCGHDYLLHNTRGDQSQVQSLGHEFSRVLCKTFQGRVLNKTGWNSWSTHRLRHTMASNLVSAGADAATVMAAGGWRTYEAMCGYAKVDEDVARRGYDEATKRARDLKATAPRKKTLSVNEFLDRKRKTA